MADYQTMLRQLPAVDRLLNEPATIHGTSGLPRRIVKEAVQEIIDNYRLFITEHQNEADKLASLDLSVNRLAERAANLAKKKAFSGFKPVINATGVVIHTNLGRAPLPHAAASAMEAAALNFNNLELNLDTGKRGSRQDHLEELICELTGAEAAAVFNNNAAAVFIVLNTLAKDGEVVVSRGELVEIGGSFRIPDIMAASGAALVEVGTTNKTYLKDYERVLNEQTRALLKVHTSNFQMVGFTAAASTGELAKLAHERGLPLIEDLGSGVLLDTAKYGLPLEPQVKESLLAGVDLVTFSGDKMLGGPQAGLVVGRKALIEKIKANQLARVIRVDKLSIAALLATLKLYYDEKRALSEIPVWRMLTFSKGYLGERAQSLKQKLAPVFGAENITLLPGISRVGGGAMPNAELPTMLVEIRVDSCRITAASLAARARQAEVPVIMRLKQQNLILDPRTIFAEQDDQLVESLQKAYNC